jgi:phosphoglycerol transferase
MNPGLLINFALQSVVPAICIALYGASPFWLLSSVLLSAATFLTAQLSARAPMKIVLCFVSGLAMFLTLMLGASYYMQGTGFNSQYFYHLDFSTLPVAMSAYGRAFIPAMLGLFLAFFAPLAFYRWPAQRLAGALPAILLWVGAIALSYPVHSLVAYRLGVRDAISGVVPELPKARAARQQPAAGAGNSYWAEPDVAEAGQKSIIFIYAEGLERTYFDRDVFGDLLPNLRELSEDAHQFTNVYQASGTGWTIAGMIASQCGFPLIVRNRLASNTSIASIDRPFDGEFCFADILKQRGYRTVFMGGAHLDLRVKVTFCVRTDMKRYLVGKS